MPCFRDADAFRTSARYFASIAKQLPDWDINDLGRALIIRDRALSGRHMLPYQLDQMRALEHALSALPQAGEGNDSLTFASNFYTEVGQLE